MRGITIILKELNKKELKKEKNLTYLKLRRPNIAMLAPICNYKTSQKLQNCDFEEKFYVLTVTMKKLC